MNKIEYYRKLKYPEYAKPHKNGLKNSYELLDLSVDDGQIISQKLLKILFDNKTIASKYVYSQDQELINLISNYLKINKNNILITSGSDGALGVISKLLIDKDTRVAIPVPSFGRFEFHAKINFGKISFFGTQKFPFDINLDKFLDYCKKRNIEVVYLANPNNPTGIYKSKDILEMFIKNFKGYIILDEALADYLGESSANLVNIYSNLVVIKSFSKLFGLAGMRIGYIIANRKIIKTLQTLVSPFEVNSLAIKLSIEVLNNRAQIIQERREDLMKSLRIIWKFKHNNFQFTPSQSSTVTLLSHQKNDVYEQLLSHKIRGVSGKDFRGLEKFNCVRLSIKNYQNVRKLLTILNKFK